MLEGVGKRKYLDIFHVNSGKNRKKMRPKTRLDYLIMQNHCEEAIESLKKYEDLSEWIIDYEQLFFDLTITPDGLPTIIKDSFRGEPFFGIRNFCEFYLELKG